jgi:hypothetical protein
MVVAEAKIGTSADGGHNRGDIGMDIGTTRALRRLCSAAARAAADPELFVCAYLGEDGVTPMVRNTPSPREWSFGDQGHPVWVELCSLARDCGLKVGESEHVCDVEGRFEVFHTQFIALPAACAVHFPVLAREGSRSPTLSPPLEAIASPGRAVSAKRAASREDPPPLAKRRASSGCPRRRWSASTTYSGTTISSINGTWPLPPDSDDSDSDSLWGSPELFAA